MIGDATLTVSWPMRTVGNEYLLYLADLKITGDGECYVDPENLNPDSLQVIKVNYIISEYCCIKRSTLLGSGGGRGGIEVK